MEESLSENLFPWIPFLSHEGFDDLGEYFRQGVYILDDEIVGWIAHLSEVVVSPLIHGDAERPDTFLPGLEQCHHGIMEGVFV